MYRIPGFNKRCNRCQLGCGHAVPGQSEVPFDDVALIIISAYPGSKEIASGITLVGKDIAKPSKTIGAGEFLRMSLQSVFDRDPEFPEELKPFESFCYMTNALHCSPMVAGEKKNVTQAMINKCKDEWLSQELTRFDPRVPILLAGGEAVKSILGKDYSLYASRRQVFRYHDHPTLVTFNPVEGERGLTKILDNPNAEEDLRKLFTQFKGLGKKTQRLISSNYWKPVLPGTMPWHYKRDLDSVKELVLRYYSEKRRYN